MVISKLQEEVIKLWTKQHWSFLNPDIEEVQSSDGSEDYVESNGYQSLNKVSRGDCDKMPLEIGGHVLRKRKQSYATVRPRRSSSHFQYYRGMCHDIARHKKKPSVDSGLKSPSKA